MIEQQGRVVAAGSDRISVRLGASSGCSACDAGRGCGAGVFGRLLQRKPVVIDFRNTIEAETGQAVVVGLPESLFMALVSRLYLYPLLAGLAGAIGGHLVATALGWTEGVTDFAALVAGLAAAALVLRLGRKRPVEFSAHTAVHLLRKTDCQDS